MVHLDISFPPGISIQSVTYVLICYLDKYDEYVIWIRTSAHKAFAFTYGINRHSHYLSSVIGLVIGFQYANLGGGRKQTYSNLS